MENEREKRRRYAGSTPCPLCTLCPECGLIAHDDKPSMHAPLCAKREKENHGKRNL